MCGRFAQFLEQEALSDFFDIGSDQIPAFPPRYNICPTQDIAVIRQQQTRRLVSMRWGFVPHWYKRANGGPLLINARAETIATKPAFRQACRTQRCLIPASGFYEWSGSKETGKQPWYIAPSGNAPLAFAGIWQDWCDPDGPAISTCAIVTTQANDALKHIHHRMPVLIAAPDFDLWLGVSGVGAAKLMRPAPDNALKCHKVSSEIGSPAAQGAALIAAI